ncbi:ribonuclease P 40kDa subunit-domain-containing protein [Amylocystis lapponica]|nr:ribonuclease P 40kDa subunit-domain-containing protein [Amylocystis lapponica]
MDAPPPTPRHTRLSTGTYGPNDTKLQQLASTHPFTQQLDVVFPSSATLESVLQRSESEYWACKSSLSAFLESAKAFVSRYAMDSIITALGMPGPDSEDVWSLDTRGLLTLAVTKDTYERLGLVGQRMPWKACDDTFIIHISLHEEVPHDTKPTKKWHRLGSKQKDALRAWDARRGPWHIMYNYQNQAHIATGIEGSAARGVKPSMRKAAGIHVPGVRLRPRPHEDEPDAVDDWDEYMSSLFEWVGMVCMGAQRLEASDRADPYLAVYTPPAGSHVGNITHMRWTGLLPPAFVQSVIDATINDDGWHNSDAPGGSPASRFVAFTGHGVPTTPVAYLPLRDVMSTPIRAPRAESEDTWSLIMTNDREPGLNGSTSVEWVLAESIGQWDSRWG